MSDFSANQVPESQEVPSLSELARVAGVLRHQASVAGQDTFSGFAAGYDHDTQQAIFTQQEDAHNWREIVIGTYSVTITNMYSGKRHAERTDGVVKIVETYPLFAGLTDYKESHAYTRSDGTLYQESIVRSSQHPIDERTADNLLQTLNVIQRSEPKPPRKERRGVMATAIGWLLHGSHPRPY